MRITNSALILMLLAMAVANRLGGGMEPVAEEDNWFVQYLDEKDRGDVDAEGRSLDLAVDAAGKF